MKKEADNKVSNSKGITWLAIILSLVSMCLSIAALVNVNSQAPDDSPDVQYVMYLGTNDKDTNDPVFGPDLAADHVDAVLTKHFEGFTIQGDRGRFSVSC